jgi:Zn-dependent protease with chaperone function
MKLGFTKINHKHIILQALRTALLFLFGYIVYELAMEVEHPTTSRLKTIRTKLVKFVMIFVLDLLILYALYYATGEYF